MINQFKSDNGGSVSKGDAQAWIKKYDDVHRRAKDTDTRSVFFGRDDLLRILSHKGVEGISFFFAVKPVPDLQRDVLTLVMVGTRLDGTLMWDLGTPGPGPFDPDFPCPPYCPPD